VPTNEPPTEKRNNERINVNTEREALALLLRSKTALGRLTDSEVHSVLAFLESIGFVHQAAPTAGRAGVAEPIGAAARASSLPPPAVSIIKTREELKVFRTFTLFACGTKTAAERKSGRRSTRRLASAAARNRLKSGPHLKRSNEFNARC
jgi:hypothetical protein